MHKIRNVESYLPAHWHADVSRRLRSAWGMTNYDEARRALLNVHRWLSEHSTAAASLMEGLEETLTLHRLKVPPVLRVSLRTTNSIESVFSQVQAICHRVNRWRNGKMVQRWVGTALTHIEPKLRKIMGTPVGCGFAGPSKSSLAFTVVKFARFLCAVSERRCMINSPYPAHRNFHNGTDSLHVVGRWYGSRDSTLGTTNSSAMNSRRSLILIGASLTLVMAAVAWGVMNGWSCQTAVPVSLAVMLDNQVKAESTNSPQTQPASIKCLRTFVGHTDWIAAVAMSPDGKLAATGGADRVIRVWNLESVAEPTQLAGHSGDVTCLVFLPDGTLVSGSADRSIRLWDVAHGNSRMVSTASSWITTIALSGDGRRLLVARGDNAIEILKLPGFERERLLAGHSRPVRSIVATSEVVLSGSQDRTARVWKLSDGTCAKPLQGHAGEISAVAISPDGVLGATAGRDRTIKIWRMADGALIRTLEGHSDWVSSLAFSPTGTHLLSGGADRQVKAWRIKDGICVGKLDDFYGPVTGIALRNGHPSQFVTVGGQGDSTLRLWDVLQLLRQ